MALLVPVQEHAPVTGAVPREQRQDLVSVPEHVQISVRAGIAQAHRTITPILRGYAQLVFASRSWIGFVVLCATLLHPAIGLAGLVAGSAATLAARGLGYRADAVQAGQYGFNAILVGLALGSHGLGGTVLALCLLAGIATTMLSATLADFLHRTAGLPALVLPFVLLCTVLLPAVPPSSSWIPLHQSLSPVTPPLTVTGTKLLQSFGAIVFQPDALVGLLVFAGCVASSRIAATLALAGVAVSLAMCRLLQAPAGAELGAAYNSVLAAVAVGAFFFVPGRSAVLLALASAATAAWCSLSLAVLLGKVGLPLLAWPFVLVSLVSIRALQLRAPDRAPFAAPLAGLSPEANLEYATNRSRRFGLPGPPQLYMPVAGEWCVSQGARGEHTHRGAWEGALDFEVVDENGFPFCGEGRETTDYYAFGKPVYAPGSGTVAAVHDGLSDGRPGDIDSTHPWGNAVVLQHGPELFSVLAHLKCGSIAVKPGAWVTSGQPIAECGSSGRSPRPHLHLQAQRSAELGAPAVPFRLLHFFCLRSKSPRYFSCGLPEEGDHVRAAQPSGVIRSFAILAPGTEWELVRDGTQQSVRIRSEITPLGERFLHELQSGDRLYFVPQDGGVVFTTLLGGESGPLRALFLALPRLPCAEGTHFQFLDEPPQSLFLRGMARWFAEATRLLVDAVATQSTSEVRGTPGAVVIETTAGSGWGRVRRFPFRGRVELDATGIRALEVIDERRPSQPLWRGRRAG